MYSSELLLKRLSSERIRDLYREADSERQLAFLRLGWRSGLARSLMALARRLEPSVVGHTRGLSRS